MEQISEMERLRNMLMQAQENNTLTLRRDMLETLFSRCFAAIRAQKPLYLLFPDLKNGLEQTKEAAEQMLAVLPESARKGGFTLTAVTPEDAEKYPADQIADGSKTEECSSLLAGYYAGLVLGEAPDAQADALLAAVQVSAPDMEPYENIYALCHYGKEPFITDEPEQFWHYWRQIATRRGEQIYGALNAILKHLPRPALLYLRQKQEEQKANAAENKAQKEREALAEQGRAILREMESRAGEIRKCAERVQALSEDWEAPDEAEALLFAAEQAFSDVSESRNKIADIGEAADASLEAADKLLHDAEQAIADAKSAMENRKEPPSVLEACNAALQKAAAQVVEMEEYNEEKAAELRKTVNAKMELLSHETGAECDRLCRFASHILNQLTAKEKAAKKEDAAENPMAAAPFPAGPWVSVPMSVQMPRMMAGQVSVQLPRQGGVSVAVQQTRPTPVPGQITASFPLQNPPSITVQNPPVQKASLSENTQTGNSAQKIAEQAVSHAVVRYREMQNTCRQAGALDEQFSTVLRGGSNTPDARSRLKALAEQTTTAWTKTAALAEETAAVCRDALKHMHPEQIKKQLETMIAGAQKLAQQSGQRVQQIISAQAVSVPESKASGLMANANAAYQAGHQLYLKAVQGALMTAHRAEKDAQADGTPASAMAQLLVVQRAAGQVAQIPELLRGHEERIIAYTNAAMQQMPQLARDAEVLRRNAQNDRKNTESVIGTLSDIIRRLTEMSQMTAVIPSMDSGTVPPLPPERSELCILLSQMLPMIEEANRKAVQRAEGDSRKKYPAYPELDGLEEGTLFGHRYQKNAKATHEININGSFWEKYPLRFLSESELGKEHYESAQYAKYAGTLNFMRMMLMHWAWDADAEMIRVNTGEANGTQFCRADRNEALYCLLWALAVFYQDDSALVTKLRSLPLYHKYFSQGCAAAFFSGKQGTDRCNMAIFLALLHAGCMLQLNLIYPRIQMRAGFDDPELKQAAAYCRALRLTDVLDDALYYGILQNGLDQKNYRLVRIWMLMDKLLQG